MLSQSPKKQVLLSKIKLNYWKYIKEEGEQDLLRLHCWWACRQILKLFPRLHPHREEYWNRWLAGQYISIHKGFVTEGKRHIEINNLPGYYFLHAEVFEIEENVGRMENHSEAIPVRFRLREEGWVVRGSLEIWYKGDKELSQEQKFTLPEECFLLGSCQNRQVF